MKEIIYRDLSKLTTGELAGKKGSTALWQKLPYETAEFKGVGLLAGENSFPESISLQLNVKGWYKIYLGMTQIGNNNMISVALSKEKGLIALSPSHIDSIDGTCSWARYDWCEEIFYKEANLTGQELTIGKSKNYPLPNTVALLYVKLVAMTEEEILAQQSYKNTHKIAYHFDLDYTCWNDYTRADDYLGAINRLQGGHGDVLIHEVAINPKKPKNVKDTVYWERIKKSFAIFHKNKNGTYKKLSERAHEMDMKIVAGCRMEGVSGFVKPFKDTCLMYGSSKQKREYRIETRAGRFIEANSFAYPEVREKVKKALLKAVPASWDGICLFLHRGIFVGFEKPIQDRVFEKYGVDAKRLPYGDYRLTEALCEVMTAFIKELKEGLQDLAKANGKEKYLLQVVALYDMQNSKEFGYDIEAWAKEGLIDSVHQGLMGYREVLDDCIAEDGLIDLAKYTQEQKTRHVFTRQYDDAISSITKGVADWLNITEKYGVDFYATLMWEHADYNVQLAAERAQYKTGAKKFLSWDSGQLSKVAALQARKEIADVKKMLSDDMPKAYRKVVRVLSLGDCDISTFNPNWMG